MTSKVALVTGGSRGLGRSISTALAESGVGVILTYRTGENEAQAAVEEITKMGGKAAKLYLDVTQFDDYGKFVADVRATLSSVFGQSHLDYLVNNAGIGAYSAFADTSVETFDELFSVNVKAPFFLTRALLDTLADHSRVLNVSTAVVRAVVPGLSAYAASKGAVEVLTRYLAVELAERQIRVNTLVGGAIDTGFGHGMMLTEEVQAMARQQIALGRIGHPEDMAAAVPAILSDAFAWATGSIIELSGGQDL
jgi:NAD(P)-dependent dehydrogenase (short-subunit alcohol dehydrogenase family)